MIKEAIESSQMFFTPEIGIYAMAFSLALKRKVREAQEGICHSCGEKPRKLQVHHRQPVFLGGGDDIENAIGVCPQCHVELDRMAFRDGIFYPQVYGLEEKDEP